MKIILLSIFISLLFGNLYAQDETLDLISKVGTEHGAYSSHHFLDENTIVVTFEKTILVVNRSGEILSQGPNPFYKKKLKYNPFLHGGYSGKYDVTCKVNGDKLMFVRNYSSPDREFFELPIPPVQGLIGSVDKYNDPASSLEGYYSKVSQELFFSAKDEVIIARAYISRCEKTHGNTLPEKDKYNTFVRLIFMDLATKTITEEYILKDVFSIERSKSSYIDFQILNFEDGRINIGVLEARSKLVHPVVNGFSYAGKYKLYSYDINTKNITLAEQDFVTEPEAIDSKIEMNSECLSITWNEHILNSDKFSLHNKTYRLTENLNFDSLSYHFPTDIIALPSVSFYPPEEYLTMKNERVCVLEATAVQNRWGKNPIPVYVVVKPSGEYELIKKAMKYGGIYFYDQRRYNLQLEGERYQSFCESVIPLLNDKNDEKVNNVTSLRRDIDIEKMLDGKIIAYIHEFTSTYSYAKLKPADYLLKFYFFDFNL
jgi:hypothetical protein